MLSTAATAALGLASVGAAGVVGGDEEPDTPLEQTGQTTATAGAGSPTSGAGGSPTGGAGGSPTGGAGGSPTARGPETGSGLSDNAAGMSSAEVSALIGGALVILGGGAYIATRRPNEDR